MAFVKEGNRLIRRQGTEILMIEPWGAGLRVRATRMAQMPEEDWALLEGVGAQAHIDINTGENEASITNGDITAKINREGWLKF